MLDSKKDILSKDTRYGSFHAFRTGAVYNNNNRRVNDLGSNDYWESGAVNPQLVLADYSVSCIPDCCLPIPWSITNNSNDQKPFRNVRVAGLLYCCCCWPFCWTSR
jgi:hypothetical protein